MGLGPRIRNLAALVRSGNFRHVARYYGDRLRALPPSIARAAALDIWYARRLLRGDAPSRFTHLGARAVHHTSYEILKLIFAAAKPRPDDVMVDVGSGKGRVIIYWLHNNYGRRIVGLELDPDIAARTAEQFRRFPKVRIVAGDAIVNVPDDGTFFYLYNPFVEEKVVDFERRVRALPDAQRVRVVYYNPNYLDVFGQDRWAREVIQLNGVLDYRTLKRFCFPVAILDRRATRTTGASAKRP